MSGGGEMGARIRAFDWTGTPVGPVERWPQSLRIALGIMVGSRYPMFVWWGEALTKFYNDAYISVLGKRHPWALGQPASEVWHEIWDTLGPQSLAVLHENRASWNDRVQLIMERNGYLEEVYFTFSYSPVPGDDGRVAGVFCACSEDTARVVGERRLAALRQLADKGAGARDVDEACRLAAETLDLNPREVSFALIYLLEPDGRSARLAASTRPACDPAVASATVILSARADSLPWPFERARCGERIKVTGLGENGHPLPGGEWPESTQTAMVLPLAKGALGQFSGLVVLGASPRREFDDSYQGFMELVAGAIASAVAKAQAYDDARKRAEALAELDRAKTAFFNNVSHEFRTPLTLMLGPLEELRARANSAPALVQRSEIDVVHRNSLRLLKLVNTLLDFSRFEAGRAQAAFIETDLARLTSDLASLFRSAMAKAELNFVIDCPPLPQAVWVDPDLWEKIVFNLLSNALKFTLAGEVRVAMRASPAHAVLSVRDTGLGVAPNELPNLFKRFHRVETSRGRTHEGTGIGLALVQELVKLHGGTIAVTSEEGRGSEFIVSIPFGENHLPREHIVSSRADRGPSSRRDAFLEEALGWLPDRAGRALPLEKPKDPSAPEVAESSAPPVPAQTAIRDPRRRLPRILLAEDNSDMRDYVHRLLRDRYEVQTVGDGAAALEAARRAPPDLILSDVMMPEMGGFELLQRLRMDEQLRTTPVILLSARAGEEARVEGAAQGADDYLTKPFSARELLARVRVHLELARVRREAEAVVGNERRRLRDLFTHAPAFICVLRGRDHVFELANAHYLTLVGRTDAIIGRPVREALPEIEGQGYFELLDRVYATGEPFLGSEMKVSLATAEGPLRDAFINFVYQPTRGPDDEIDGILFHGVDVTKETNARRQVEELVVIVGEERDRAVAAEDQARTQLAELSAVYGAAPVGLAMLDRELRFVRINEMLASINGVPVAQTLGRAIGEVLPTMADKIEPAYRRVFETGEAIRFEVEGEMPNAPGVRRHFIVYDYPIADADGVVHSVGCVVWEVTERKQAEVQLRRNHDTFFSLIQNAPFGVYVIDAQFRLRQVSSGSQKIFAGIQPLLGRDFADVLRTVWNEPFASEAIALFRRTLETGEPYRSPSTEEVRANLGELEAYDWRIERVTLPDGDFGVVCYFYDLTERRAAEETVRLHRELLETVVRHLQVGAALVRGSDLRYQLVNDAYQAIAPGRTILGKTVDEAGPDAPPHFRERCREVLETGVPYEGVDEPMLVYDPSEARTNLAYFSWSIHRVRLPGEEGRGLLLSATDTTKRKSVENALHEAHALLTDKATHLELLVQQRTTRMRETISELEAFSYSIAHDMRAPLRSLQGFSDVLLADYADKLDAEGQSFLLRISKSAGRMDKLIQDVLSYSRVVRGEWPLEPVDVAQLLRGIAETYPMLAPENADITLEGDFPLVLGSEAMLMQIFSNLLGNAVKFVPSGTKPRIRVWAEPRGERLCLFVRDNGIGIAPDQHEKIFRIFHQGGKNFEGTGIGLAIVKKAVERMNGRVGVDSNLGQPTTFWIDVQRA